ncbi:endonuclease/exonuclease/phosphatase family protein, partial [Streptomyces sp. NRRL S-15]
PPPRPRFRCHGRGALTSSCSILLTLLLLCHGWIPNTHGRLGSLLDTLLPWTALAIPPLLVTALLRRAWPALAALALPTLVWTTLFGPALAPKSVPGGDLTVVSHNVNQDNRDPQGTVRSLLAARPDVLALQELSPRTAPAYQRALASSYPYHYYEETVGLWSTYPLHNARAVPIMPWTRSVRATVDTPEGPLAVYVVHLPSVRVTTAGFTTRGRDEALGRLAAHVGSDNPRRLVMMGDFNGSTDDRALQPLTTAMDSAQSTAGHGFGFTWPSAFPITRIDEILTKGVEATSAWTLPATTSDHLPVAARIALRGS